MKIVGNSIQKGFLVRYRGKNYYVNYLDADYPSSALVNRNNWEVVDENGEEISPYLFKSSKKEKEAELYYKLVEFCINNFNFDKSKAQIP